MMKEKCSKYYEKFKKIIKLNYKEIIFLILFACFCFYDTGYLIFKPGGTINTASRIEGDNLYESEGSFNMAYVGMMEGNLPFYLLAKVIDDWTLVKNTSITYSENEKVEDALKRDELSYDEAISNATFVAFNKANVKFDITKTYNHITYISDKNTSDLKIVDILLSYDDTVFNDIEVFINYVNSKKVNDKIILKILRDGKEQLKEVTIYEEDNKLYVGLSVTKIYDIKSDFDLNVKKKASESGPSGGLITALTIYDAITKEDITRGYKIVGTGTINLDGTVGEIGSVEYKLAGAVKDNADIFICPIGNYEDAIKYAKEKKYDIIIKGVTSFDETLTILENIKEKK